jgi:PAS domain-containing protein
MRTTFTILAFPLLVAIVSDIAAVRPGRVLTFVTVACVLVSVLSALGVPINGTVTAIDQTRFPWGEILTVVDRRGALWAAPVYGVVPFLADVVRLPLPYVGTLQFALWVPVLSLLLSREYARCDERLAASEERYRILIESAPDAIVVLDLGAGRFVDYNQKAVDLFGYPPEELVMKSARYSTGTRTNISAV